RRIAGNTLDKAVIIDRAVGAARARVGLVASRAVTGDVRRVDRERPLQSDRRIHRETFLDVVRDVQSRQPDALTQEIACQTAIAGRVREALPLADMMSVVAVAADRAVIGDRARTGHGFQPLQLVDVAVPTVIATAG